MRKTELMKDLLQEINSCLDIYIIDMNRELKVKVSDGKKERWVKVERIEAGVVYTDTISFPLNAVLDIADWNVPSSDEDQKGCCCCSNLK